MARTWLSIRVELGPSLDDRRTKLPRLGPGEQFLYTFDLGDGWTHLCTVGPVRIDPEDELGNVPAVPLPFFGWGDIPDQYGRRWDADDGEGPLPEDPGLPEVPGLLTRRPTTRKESRSAVSPDDAERPSQAPRA